MGPSFLPDASSGNFSGALFDGRYVYFIPYQNGPTSAYTSTVARYDTSKVFSKTGAWESFDVSGLDAGSGAVLSGFFGGTFDGRFVYLVPRDDGAPDGRVLRFNRRSGRRECGTPRRRSGGRRGEYDRRGRQRSARID